MVRNAITSRIVCDELGVDPETVRLWRNGSRMPHDRKMRLLARLVGVPEAVLRYGNPPEALPLANGTTTVRDDDERTLLEAYRQLPDWAKRSLRARAGELLENFAPKNSLNPYGKRTVQK